MSSRIRGALPAMASVVMGVVAGRHAPRSSAHLLDGAPPVVAHRGFSSAAPENTLAAFRRAAQLGVMMELDVTLAATGEVVVIHDDTLERTTTGAGRVSETPWDALRTLDAGSWFGPEFAEERVPTLAQVLEVIGGRVVIDIELKITQAREALARGVVEVVRRAGQVDRVFVSSFDPLLLAQVRRLEPRLRRGQLVDTFEDTDLVWYGKLVLRHLGLNRQARPDMVIGGDRLASKRWVERYKARGYAVMVYTVNEPERMAELRAWGVDAVITDTPDVALAALG